MERRKIGLHTGGNEQPVMLDLLLEPNKNKDSPSPSLSLKQLIDVASIFLVAGSDTTAYTLSCATFYILSTPGVLAKLREELARVPVRENGRFEWKHVQNLPYLVSAYSLEAKPRV